VRRLPKALRRKAAEQMVAREVLGETTIAAALPGVVGGSGYIGPDPPVEQAAKATWRGPSIEIESTANGAIRVTSAGEAIRGSILQAE
jgi:hypothetical protein